MKLADLKTRYLGSVPARDNATDVEILIDGRRYLLEMATQIESAVAGDRIYLLDWYFDPALDLRGRGPNSPGYVAIGDLLARRAADGVDVRLVLNGAQYLGAIGAPGYTTCYEAMLDLLARNPTGATPPPLLGRVLYDWSGAELTGSQHQKALVTLQNGQLTALAAGIDVNPLMLDDAPHNSRLLPGTVPPVSWGWHDGGIRLVGGAAADVYDNFADRWLEAEALPPSRLWVKGRGTLLPHPVQYAPHSVGSVPAASAKPANTPTVDSSVQVLRSRYRTKLNRPWRRQPWLTQGGGELVQVHETLVKAIRGAQEYIYIEDQFLADHPALPSVAHHPIWWTVDHLIGQGRLGEFSLLPHLAEALARNVKVIAVGSGYADPGDLIPGPKNRQLHPELERIAAVNPECLAVWRIEDVTVHTKLTVIDDCFLAIGSSNLQSRSMLGIDSELQVATVTAGVNIRNVRAALWAEHLGLDYSSVAGTLKSSMEDLSTALGMWRSHWGRADGTWFQTGMPVGYSPAVPGTPRVRMVRSFVGPGNKP